MVSSETFGKTPASVQRVDASEPHIVAIAEGEGVLGLVFCALPESPPYINQWVKHRIISIMENHPRKSVKTQ